MAVTWKKVLASGQVVSADLATEGSTGYVLTTDGSGSLSYTAKTVNTNTNQLTTWDVDADQVTSATTISHGETMTFTGGTGISTDLTADGTLTITNDSPDVNHNTDIDVDKANLLARLDDIDGNWTLGSGTSIDGTISGDLTVTGDLTVSGDTTTLNVSTISVEDDEIALLHNVANDTTDSAISFGMNTSTKEKVIGHDASKTRIVIGGSIVSGALADIEGFVATIESHATSPPNGDGDIGTSDTGSGIGSFWIEEDTNYLYVRVE